MKVSSLIAAVLFAGTTMTGVVFADGSTLDVDAVVLATGYVMPDCVKSDLHRVASSFAVDAC
mgnify:CR=1 FL=1